MAHSPAPEKYFGFGCRDTVGMPTGGYSSETMQQVAASFLKCCVSLTESNHRSVEEL